MARAAAVDRVAYQRMTDVLEMNADLVRAAGLEPAFDQGGMAEALEHPERGARRLAALVYRHAGAHAHVAAERRVDDAAGRRIALHQREVNPAHAALGKLPGEARLRR